MSRLLPVASSLLLAIATSALLNSCQASNSATLLQKGELELLANGEDFVRQPFVSKDGWQIQFEQVSINLSDITAYQADVPVDAEASAPSPQLENHPQVQLHSRGPVDLAAGDQDAAPISVDTVSTVPGHYNALTWQITRATSGPHTGQTLVMTGTASKADRHLTFTLALDREYAYQCGEYIGDQRKGIVKAGQTSQIEATFHFDHIFGDGTRPSTDAVNQAALGFEPFVALATDQQIQANFQTLQAQLQPADLATLDAGLQSLGHVGEGHCRTVAIAP